jgi:hypothetical protein
MATDPYAAIRTLGIGYTPGSVTERYDDVSGTTVSDTQNERWTTDWSKLGGFQSKYNSLIPLEDGRVRAVVQAPGGDKYDTLLVDYKQGPNGQWVMDGTPQAERHKSSASRALKAASVLAVPLGVGAAAGAGLLGGGMQAASAAGGGLFGTAAAAADPLAAYMTTGGVEGSIIGGGTGGAAGSVGAGTGLLNAVDPLADYMTTGGVEGSITGGGTGGGAGSVGGGLLDGGAIKQLPSSLPGSTPVPGEALPVGTTPPATVPTAPPALGGWNGPSWVPEELRGVWDVIKNNPRLVGALVGGGLGAVEAGNQNNTPAPYTGPMPTITRGGFQAQATPSYRQVPQFGLLAPQGKQVQGSGLHQYGLLNRG